MTKEQILEKAIKKAVKNGWNGLEMWSKTFSVSCDKTKSLRNRVWIEYEDGDGEMAMLRDIIFDHDFAKAFWGEGLYCVRPGNKSVAWQFHLQQMVLEKDTLKYLKQFL